MSFGNRLRSAMDVRGRLCVGIDPHPELMDAWGLTDSVFGLERFAMTALEAVGGIVPVLKPQSAFFERHGSGGIDVLEKLIAGSRALGALVLLDVKRGDVGSTSQAYADAYLTPGSPLAADAITVNPFLGLGSLDPVIDTALRHDAGVFVVALTSNREGALFQRATTAEGRTVAGTILEAVATRNAGTQGLGSVGAVVGATVGDIRERLDVNGPLLVPGIGAQGGTLEDVCRIFSSVLPNVLPSSSREILGAGPSKQQLHGAAQAAIERFAGLVAPDS
ncbi:orotidine-5'-phosphate decarboxylase [soil metagenome]